MQQADGSIRHHHTWTNPTGHQIGAYAGDTKWSSKVSASSGRVWHGIGTIALDKHLQNKAKRYHHQNNESALPKTTIMESLSDTERQDNGQRYAEWMKQNPATAFGHRGTYAVESPVKDLFEAARLREEHDKRFNQGKEPREWGLFDFRSGKPK